MFNNFYIGKYKIHLSSVDSTNNYLKRIIANTEPIYPGTVIMADNQYKGRGQRNNIWISEPGKNLTMSFFLVLDLDIKEVFVLNKIFSLAINNYISNTLNMCTHIKWPNDFIVQGKKICGLLIENFISGQVINKCIIGIGLNVNQERFYDTNKGIQITSMKAASDKQYDVHKVLEDLCKNINREYINFCNSRLNANYLESLHLRYLDNLYCYNKEMSFIDIKTNKTFKAKVIDVSKKGELVLYTDNGIKYYEFKSISWLI